MKRIIILLMICISGVVWLTGCNKDVLKYKIDGGKLLLRDIEEKQKNLRMC